MAASIRAYDSGVRRSARPQVSAGEACKNKHESAPCLEMAAVVHHREQMLSSVPEVRQRPEDFKAGLRQLLSYGACECVPLAFRPAKVCRQPEALYIRPSHSVFHDRLHENFCIAFPRNVCYESQRYCLPGNHAAPLTNEVMSRVSCLKEIGGKGLQLVS